MAVALPVSIDGVTYDRATIRDESSVLGLMISDFCLTEPLNEVLEITPEESAPSFALCVRRALSDGISFKMTDEASGQLVGALLSFVARKSAKDADEEEANKIMNLVPARLKPLAHFVGEVACEGAPDVFQEYGVEKYVDFFVINIHKDYRGKGIAQNMMKISYEIWKNEGFRIVKVLATNPRTEHVFRNKQGFKEVASYKVLDYVVDGKPYFNGIKELEVAYTFVKDLAQ